MALVDTYKARLGLGVRNNKFTVRMKFPSAITQANGLTDFEILAIGHEAPAPRKIKYEQQTYQNEQFMVAIERDKQEEVVSFTFKDNYISETDNYTVRKALIEWMNLVKKPGRGADTNNDGSMSLPGEHEVDGVIVEQLGVKNEVIRTWKYYGMKVQDVGEKKTLNKAEDAKLSEFSANFAIDWYEEY